MMRPFEFRNCSVAIWSGAPTLADCELALASASALYDANGGEKVILIGVFKGDVKMPSAEVDKRMVECWPQLFKVASSIQCISLPGGFTAANILAMIASVFTRHGRRVSIYRTIPAAMLELRRLSPDFPTAELESLIIENLKS